MLIDVAFLRQRVALSGTHPVFESRASVYGPSEGPIVLTGTIQCRFCDVRAGRFHRTLVKQEGGWIAIHEDFRVELAFRRLGIAQAHYTDYYTLYLELGIKRVEMFALEFGPFVWPQFGFTFKVQSEKEEAWRRYLEALLTGPEDELVDNREEDREAYVLVFLKSEDGSQVGASALKRTAEAQESGSIQLVIDFEDSRQIEFLKSVGLLADVEKTT